MAFEQGCGFGGDVFLSRNPLTERGFSEAATFLRKPPDKPPPIPTLSQGKCGNRAMDRRIIDLEATPFSGRRLTRRQIADIRETVAPFPDDSRNAPAKTICEHLGRRTAKGSCRVGACLGMPETLEGHGIPTLPPRREGSVRDMKAANRPDRTSASDPQPEIAVPLAALRPLRVAPVTDTEGRQLRNAFVDRHHYLVVYQKQEIPFFSGSWHDPAAAITWHMT